MTNRESKLVLTAGIICAVLLGGAIRPARAQESLAQVVLPSVPAGIAVDGQHLWVLDADAGKVHHVAIRSGQVDRSLDIDVANPRGLAFDGRRLWVADSRGGMLTAVDLESGATLERIMLGEGALAACDSIEDVAWDGNYLWVACYGGFSSTFNQIDPETGRVTRSVFANCNPRGIATDGNTVWSVCYNGENFPSKIDARSIVPNDHEMQASRRFLLDIEGRTPVGLAQDGGLLWYADRATRTAYQVRPGDRRGGN